MHTYVTTRDLQLVHFDGSSASKLASGSMDVIDLLIWDEFDEGRVWDEYPRIKALCEWGERWGIDGYIRCDSLMYPRQYFLSIYTLPPGCRWICGSTISNVYRVYEMTPAAVR